MRLLPALVHVNDTASTSGSQLQPAAAPVPDIPSMTVESPGTSYCCGCGSLGTSTRRCHRTPSVYPQGLSWRSELPVLPYVSPSHVGWSIPGHVLLAFRAESRCGVAYALAWCENDNWMRYPAGIVSLHRAHRYLVPRIYFVVTPLHGSVKFLGHLGLVVG